MSAYFEGLNVLGKGWFTSLSISLSLSFIQIKVFIRLDVEINQFLVDPLRTVITPDAFHFKLKEHLSLNDRDYEMFKHSLLASTPSHAHSTSSSSSAYLSSLYQHHYQQQRQSPPKPPVEPPKDWLEAEKNKRFNDLFKSLWPNLYQAAKIEPAKDESKAALAAEYEKNRALYQLLAQQDLIRYKASLDAANAAAAAKQTPPPAPSSKSDSVKISIDGFSSGRPKIEITTSDWKSSPQSPSPSAPKMNISQVSGYNMSSYASHAAAVTKKEDEKAELIKSIRESQEKLKMMHKVEQTNELVDDILKKAGRLQQEIKSKSDALKVQQELAKEQTRVNDELRRSYSSLMLAAAAANATDSDEHCYHSHQQHASRCHHHNRVIVAASRSPVDERCCSRSVSRRRSCSSERAVLHSRVVRTDSGDGAALRCSRSILKRTSRSRSPSSALAAESGRSCSRTHRRRSVSIVEPRVNCWHTPVKVDRHIY